MHFPTFLLCQTEIECNFLFLHGWISTAAVTEPLNADRVQHVWTFGIEQLEM